MSPLASMIIYLIIVSFSDENGRNNFQFEEHPEADLTFGQILRRNGYPFEIHTIETEDHYILSLYRIPYGRDLNSGSSKNRSAVLIVHGMGGTAEHYTNLGRDHALVYYLADRNFDVWLMCGRGTKQSSKHRYYDSDRDFEYWNYSFHEVGMYDLPASIDYILATTGQAKLFYIGQSSGTTNYFVMTSNRKEYNDKIKISASYAPSAILNYMDVAIVKIFSSMRYQLHNLRKYIRLGCLFPFSPLISEVLKYICSEKTVLSEGCYYLLNLAGGRDSVQIDRDIVALVFSTAPARVSLLQILHFLQLIHTGFRMYDYGAKENLKIYGKSEPPEYNLTNSVAPSFLMWGEIDYLTGPKGTMAISKILKNSLSYKIGGANHIDFIFARNASSLIYEPTVRLFKAYDEGILPENIGDFNL